MNTGCSEKEDDSFMPWTQFASPSLSSPLCLWHALHWYTYSQYSRFTSCAVFILKTPTELGFRWCSFSCWLYRNQRFFYIFFLGLGLGRFQFGFTSTETRFFFCQGLGRFQFSFTSTETRWISLETRKRRRRW